MRHCISPVPQTGAYTVPPPVRDLLVRLAGFEPACRQAPVFETGVYANSTTDAYSFNDSIGRGPWTRTRIFEVMNLALCR